MTLREVSHRAAAGARPEFVEPGLAITHDENAAELRVAVDRTSFTTRFAYTVTAPRTSLVVASGRVSSLGGTASGKIAGKLLETLASARSAP